MYVEMKADMDTFFLLAMTVVIEDITLPQRLSERFQKDPCRTFPE